MKIDPKYKEIINEQKKQIERLKTESEFIGKFAKEINYHLGLNDLITQAREKLKSFFSDCYIHLEQKKFLGEFSCDWVKLEDLELHEEFSQIMKKNEILFIANSISPFSYLGEHRKEKQNIYTLGYQRALRSYIDKDISKISNILNNKFSSEELFLIIIELTKAKYRTKPRNLHYNKKLAIINKNLLAKSELAKIVKKNKEIIDKKIFHFYKKKINSFIAIPLNIKNKTLGYIHIVSEKITNEQIPFIYSIANLLSIAINNSEKYHRDVFTQKETGLPRKNLFLRYCDYYLTEKKQLGVLMTDLDYFKEYVDTFGHDQGQKVIWELGKLLKSELDDDSLICNYGGDEYAILLLDKDKEELTKISEKIRKKIENFMFQHEDSYNNKIKISIGISHTQDIDNNLNTLKQRQEMLKKADDALFYAKSAGRNRTIQWNSEIPSNRKSNGRSTK